MYQIRSEADLQAAQREAAGEIVGYKMDIQSRQAARLLDGLAVAGRRRRLVELSHELGLTPGVVRSRGDLSLRNYKLSGSVIEGYIDLELADGNAIAWLLDIGWDEAMWTIETSIAVNPNTGESQEVIEEFPNRTAATIDEFLDQLEQVVSDITASAESADLARLVSDAG